MPYLNRPNAKLFYTVAGEGQPLILINGLASDQTVEVICDFFS